jgi:sulfur carrier protein
VNGELRETKERSSLAELISELNLKPEQIAIELNQEVIRHANWETTVLREGDKIEIVHFVGGG